MSDQKRQIDSGVMIPEKKGTKTGRRKGRRRAEMAKQQGVSEATIARRARYRKAVETLVESGIPRAEVDAMSQAAAFRAARALREPETTHQKISRYLDESEAAKKRFSELLASANRAFADGCETELQRRAYRAIDGDREHFRYGGYLFSPIDDLPAPVPDAAIDRVAFHVRRFLIGHKLKSIVHAAISVR